MQGNFFVIMQRRGKALMLPIAVLPVAGLLLRPGQPDVFNIVFVTKAGQTLFDNLPLLFAIGISGGFAKDNHCAVSLAVANMDMIQEPELRKLGAMGVVKRGDTGLQGIVGTRAEIIAGEISELVNQQGGAQ
ncbi:PTS transporter subunit EIIC [Mangrovibacter phragmitis]|jgi:PTS system N-acetylglucosamine-specific IIC component|uniref:PTS transporter subunit EIIC n=1 Tax=Mangrovibacter phragmitis TaxID=1691903 RepID=UPI00351455AA